MQRKWAFVIIFTVIVFVLLTGFEIYKAFTKSKDTTEYSRYATTIPSSIDTDLLNKITDFQDKILVKDKDIAPVNSQ